MGITNAMVDDNAGIALTKLEGGGFTQGIPLRGVGGQVFYVDSSSANRGGGSESSPLGRIADAHSLCVSGRGDVIIVGSGHSETVTAAGGITISKNNVSIVGVGRGTKRPLITFSTAVGASLLLSGNGCLLRNIRFSCQGIDALTQPIDITGTDNQVDFCHFVAGNASAQPTNIINIQSTADWTRILSNEFIATTTDAGVDAAIKLVGTTSVEISDNTFFGAYTTTKGAIENVTTACVNCKVLRNRINNRTASSAKAMVFVSTSTGVIAGNHMQILTGTAPITGAAMSWVGGNYYAAVIATAGTLI